MCYIWWLKQAFWQNFLYKIRKSPTYLTSFCVANEIFMLILFTIVWIKMNTIYYCDLICNFFKNRIFVQCRDRKLFLEKFFLSFVFRFCFAENWAALFFCLPILPESWLTFARALVPIYYSWLKFLCWFCFSGFACKIFCVG